MRQRRGGIDVHIVAAPDVERGLLEQKGEADGEQHLSQRIEAERAQEHALHRQTDDGNGERRHRQRQRPGAGGVDDGQSDIAAPQKIGAMGKIDDAHDAKNQRQAAADEEQQRAIGHTVENLNDPELRIHFLRRAPVRSPHRRRSKAFAFGADRISVDRLYMPAGPLRAMSSADQKLQKGANKP